MMYPCIPYTHADYSSPDSPPFGSPILVPNHEWTPIPSIPKALPYPTTNAAIFRFSSFAPNILNCTGLGLRRWRCSIITSPKVNTHTFFYDQNGRVFATIEWGAHPVVEVLGILPTQRTAQWLRLPANQKHMTMDVDGTTYAWVASGSHMSLYTTTFPPVLLAGIVQGHGAVNVVMSQEAMTANLLKVSIVVAVLLLSGRDFV